MTVLSVQTARLLWHHVAIISSGSGPLIEAFIPFDDFTFSAAEAVSVENLSTADTHMTGDGFLAFALAECGNFFPGNVPPLSGLYGCLLPVGCIDDSQPTLRMAYPPEVHRRCFLCCWHLILLIMTASVHGHLAYGHARFAAPEVFAAASYQCGIPDWREAAVPGKCGSCDAGGGSQN